MSIEFRYAAIDEYPRVSEFLDQYWAKNHIYVRERPLFDWTFTRRAGDRDTYSFAIAENGSEIVAILGGIPFILNCFGKSSQAVWIVNYAVRPDHRRGPAALQLLSTFRRPPFDAVIASGLNPSSVMIYKVLRGIVLPEMPRHFAVLPGETARAANLLQHAYPDWSRERCEALVQAFTMSADLPDNGKCDKVLPDSWDRIDWPEIAACTVGAARDSDYLKWRYVDHPSFKYEIVAVPEGARTGLAIWRLEEITIETPEGRQPFDKIARLVEFMPTSERNGRELAGAVLTEIRAAGAFGLDFYGYRGFTRHVLEQNGVMNTVRHLDGGSIPSRFQPLDTHGGGILNAMFVSPELPACTVEADSPWYWTKSDSDQDRPN